MVSLLTDAVVYVHLPETDHRPAPLTKQTISVDTPDPKAIRLPEDLADLNLIAVKKQAETVMSLASATIAHHNTTYHAYLRSRH